MAFASLGIDYRYGGRSPATGFDCSGLVAHIYRDAYGMSLPPHTGAQAKLGKPIDLAQLETGDLVFYNTQGQPNTHVGIYIGDERFIHAPRTGAAVRIESMRGSYWKARFSGARRLVQ
ncbi:MAG: C40 family peptidase [Burkholderiales bacterium]